MKKLISYYVVCEGSDEAYKKVLEYLDKDDYYFAKDRMLDRIELIAETESCVENTKLFL